MTGVAACLGIIDWGIGGIGLLCELDTLAPGLPVVYWSDTGAIPYGRMRGDELSTRLTAVVAALAELGVTEAVLACNSASTVLGRLDATPIPVEGVISHGVASVPDDIAAVGVVGGRRTIASGRYRRGLAQPGRVVRCRVAQPLSAHIEDGRAGSPEFLADLTRILSPLRYVDALVLACTHYPAARRWFAAALPDVVLIDPVDRLAATVASRYAHATTDLRPASRTFLTTGDPEAMRRGAARAWGRELTAESRGLAVS